MLKCVLNCRDDDSDDEIDDQDIHKIMIVTQTPPPVKKHDRTGNYVTRVKMTQELSKAINDGLYYYEQVWKKLFFYSIKVWCHKNQISEIMGFVRIFWKNNVQEAYLPKMSIWG